MMSLSTSLLHNRSCQHVRACCILEQLSQFVRACCAYNCVQRIVCLQCVRYRSACAVRAQLYAHQRKCLVCKVNIAACRVLPFVKLVCLCFRPMLDCMLSDIVRSMLYAGGTWLMAECLAFTMVRCSIDSYIHIHISSHACSDAV
jgi:hypothetical protein